MGGGVVAWSLLVMVLACTAREPAAAAITCDVVSTNLRECLAYLRGQQPSPPGVCCEGVKRLEAMVPTAADRQFACNCIKQAASRYSDLKDSAVSSLPDRCGAPLTFPINRSFDCTRVP